jgi:hypothetical protein
MSENKKLLEYALLTAKYNGNESELAREIYDLVREIETEDSFFLTNALRRHVEKNEVPSLCLIVEYVRAEGVLYQDYTEQHSKFLEIALSTATWLLNDFVRVSDGSTFFYINTLYDLIFHQVRLEEYSSYCASLYFKLSLELLDSKYYRYLNEKNDDYHFCIYFIDMAHDWFSKRQEEFLVIKQKVDVFIDMNKSWGYFHEYWTLPTGTYRDDQI